MAKAYLTYPMNNVTCSALLNEMWRYSYLLEFNGETTEYNGALSKAFLKDMAEVGVIIKKKQVLGFAGKDRVDGLTVRTNIVDKDKIRVRIEGKNFEDMVLKMSAIKKYIADLGYEPKQCVWDRVGRYST